MSEIVWWTGLVFWVAASMVGACVLFILIMGTIDDLLGERLKRAGRLVDAIVFLATWAHRKEGYEIKEAAERALANNRARIRSEIELAAEKAEEYETKP